MSGFVWISELDFPHEVLSKRRMNLFLINHFKSTKNVLKFDIWRFLRKGLKVKQILLFMQVFT